MEKKVEMGTCMSFLFFGFLFLFLFFLHVISEARQINHPSPPEHDSGQTQQDNDRTGGMTDQDQTVKDGGLDLLWEAEQNHEKDSSREMTR